MLQAVLDVRSGLISTHDFKKYHNHGSRKAAKLRKKLGMTTRPGKTESLPPKPSSKPEHWEVEFWLAERSWAAAQEAKSSLESTDSPMLRRQAISKFSKAHKHATEAIELSTEADFLSESERLQLSTYAAIIEGELAVQQHNWKKLVDAYSQARVALDVLAKTTSMSVYSDLVSAQIDPALRFGLAKLSKNRTVDVPRLAKQQVAGSGTLLSKLVQQIDESALRFDSVEPSQVLGTINWRGHQASVPDADSAQAILSAQALDKELDPKSGTSGFDRVLLAWQEAADLVHELIVAAEARSSENNDQQYYIVSTYINYQVLWRRIQRDSIITKELLANPEGGLTALKDSIRVFENIVQSTEELSELRGVFSDDELSQSIVSLSSYFSTQRSLAIAKCYRLFDNHAAALALIAAAHKKLEAAKPITVELPVTQPELESFKSTLESELIRSHGLASIAKLTEKAPTFIADNTDKYPVGSSEVVLKHLANTEFSLAPIPVKPVFYDIAFNYINYPQEQQEKAVPQVAQAIEKKEETPEPQKKRGLFGIFK